MPGSILGTSVRRVEDRELITGESTYVGNLALPGLLHLAFVRSPLAHGRITGIDTAEAAAAPGVVAVFTAADLDLPAHHGLMVAQPGDAAAAAGHRPGALRRRGRRRRRGGDEGRRGRRRRAGGGRLRRRCSPSSTRRPRSRTGAPAQFEGHDNLAAGQRTDPADAEAALADAEVVVRARMVNQRLAVMPMEGNAIAVLPGGYEGRDDALTIWVSTQMPHGFRAQAAKLFGLERSSVRVITPHVGGGFGGKAGMLAEHTVAIGAARALGRPVSWVETRSENLVSMPHGRGQIAYYELGLTREGRITGLRARVVGDSGAYAGFGGALTIGPTYLMSQGVYDIPKLAFDGAVALTNTTPMGAFRGAGRPEATAHLERMMDLAADELGMDPAEIRRRNFLDPRPSRSPRCPAPATTSATTTCRCARRCASPITTSSARSSAAAARRATRSRSASGSASTSRSPRAAAAASTARSPCTPTARPRSRRAPRPTARATPPRSRCWRATGSGIPFEKIRFVQSDTALVPRGSGTGGSRSLQMGGNAVLVAADDVLEQARRRAAEMLEAAVEDIELTDSGEFGVTGVPTVTLTWAQVAGHGEELFAGLDFHQDGATYPFGAHVSVVEVDTETGKVMPRRHVAVDDCGRVLNPLLVAGQQHGGLAQGVAQALYEEILFDPEGQPLTATLADYRMPTAADLFWFETHTTETPTPMNPLGAKGIGESATVGSTPAVQNAVVDALRPFGVRHVDLPCTPERVWRAIHAGATDLWREPPAVFATLPIRAAGAGAEEGGEI